VQELSIAGQVEYAFLLELQEVIWPFKGFNLRWRIHSVISQSVPGWELPERPGLMIAKPIGSAAPVWTVNRQVRETL
jgi:hypothetical protein